MQLSAMKCAPRKLGLAHSQLLHLGRRPSARVTAESRCTVASSAQTMDLCSLEWWHSLAKGSCVRYDFEGVVGVDSSQASIEQSNSSAMPVVLSHATRGRDAVIIKSVDLDSNSYVPALDFWRFPLAWPPVDCKKIHARVTTGRCDECAAVQVPQRRSPGEERPELPERGRVLRTPRAPAARSGPRPSRLPRAALGHRLLGCHGPHRPQRRPAHPHYSTRFIGVVGTRSRCRQPRGAQRTGGASRSIYSAR